jgi:putative oxidoreductase
MKIVRFIVCLLFGLLFINAGLDKFFHYMPMPELNEQLLKLYGAFGTITWLMPLVAVIEILGGLLFIFPKTRALGALVILPVTVGILVHNATFMPSGLVMAGALFLINIWIIAENRAKYRPMIG